ncbi:hypothetical protein EJB05_15589 [Eragrostis curvula]|uniref:Uncharacterized protein n=1 Tax=Eragrostis curvula TaxID=38414 RepID=A0A5J9VBW2_9POAL|nr:hypothetical protein EJB05_15589 [Eragrostis curvula]
MPPQQPWSSRSPGVRLLWISPNRKGSTHQFAQEALFDSQADHMLAFLKQILGLHMQAIDQDDVGLVLIHLWYVPLHIYADQAEMPLPAWQLGAIVKSLIVEAHCQPRLCLTPPSLST